ncbi:hypothetical protein I316_00808 [Kwoniella heveanensis BCC8398]|uniref:DNA polymerase epsilon subunit D n=1 Tax=Kwoniella heveanensis BCC8398 TaxID=1296120 RepID=A0A1B9H332_9TREE|nr:hypothetical protein I316_00808 [Kwoniella heveanensis BCC8398]
MAPKQPPQPSKPAAKVKLSAAAAQQKANSAGIAEFDLPKSTLSKLAKGSLPDNVKMQQDVVLALVRGSTLFINYLTAAAHDQAVDRAGRTITASDVLKAITELDFGPADALIPLLEQELATYRNNIQQAKLAKKASSGAAGGPDKGRGRKSGASAVTDQDASMMEGDVDENEDGDEGEGQGEGEEGDDDDEEGEGNGDETRAEGEGEGEDEEAGEEDHGGDGDESEMIHVDEP